MNYLKVTFGIFLILASSRFVPHPPNFTSLLALSFYVPAILGLRYIPALILSFAITDLFIGFHGLALFTWGSVIFIGLISRFFLINTKNRIFGCLLGVVIFFIITNFGVWTSGTYGYTLESLILCYYMALPFFGNTLISTIILSVFIEIIIAMKVNKKLILKKLTNYVS